MIIDILWLFEFVDGNCVLEFDMYCFFFVLCWILFELLFFYLKYKKNIVNFVFDLDICLRMFIM